PGCGYSGQTHRLTFPHREPAGIREERSHRHRATAPVGVTPSLVASFLPTCALLLSLTLVSSFLLPAVFPAQPERVAVVTGGTDGIGFATAKCLAKLGMHVIIVGNNDAKALEVVRKIKEETLNDKVEFLYCDLASMRSVRQFVQKFKMKNIPLHVLVNNAGVMMVPERSTEDGFEEHFGVNYLGHFLLTNLLLDTLKASGSPGRSARVVTVSSATHYVGELNLDDLQSSSSLQKKLCLELLQQLVFCHPWMTCSDSSLRQRTWGLFSSLNCMDPRPSLRGCMWPLLTSGLILGMWGRADEEERCCPERGRRWDHVPEGWACLSRGQTAGADACCLEECCEVSQKVSPGNELADPGVVNTDLYRHVFWGTGLMKKIFGWWFSKTPEEGSWTSVYAAVSPALEGVGGHYLYNEKETRSLAITYDRKLQQQLWARSCRLTGTADVTQDALSG
uniref:Dehydrogenase/reductase SDR family member on chromosome X n=1 Tax=Camelus bactrianus TaxID=9837 RepID=A0A9W3FJ56_CAMBA